MGKRSLEETVEQSIEGGSSIIQYREKRYPQQLTTRQMLEQAKSLQKICRRHGVPFLIDDRVDLAVAIDADGVHVGQKDLPPQYVRKLIGNSKILGLTVGTFDQVDEALSHNVRADYLGTNAIFPTLTKKDAGQAVGLDGLKELVSYVRHTTRNGKHVGLVAIGGIGKENISQVMECGVDGVAVVSSVVGAESALQASRELRSTINYYQMNQSNDKARVREEMVQALLDIKKTRPLIHNLTNNVVTTQTANSLLAIGASPVMSQYHEEISDMVGIASGVLINIGTLDEYSIKAMHLAAKRANELGKPVILDPVGYGATKAREATVLELLLNHKITILKGNYGEIGRIHGNAGFAKLKGVDSESNSSNLPEMDKVVSELAQKFGCVVCMTGPVDVISDGSDIIHVYHNEPNLQHLTGVGCMTGAIQAAFASVCSNPLIAASAGCSYVALSGELAMSRMNLKDGELPPLGDFRSELFNSFSTLTPTNYRQYLNFVYQKSE
ncbi:thiamine-phosphate pyrophosphorylase [Naegleria gruberi]|uniref:Thiamine-phosphate pyrophosphorylase n=1 Tax=Naegleria gruberi TaxID=5762 RepID=D2V0B2_NAEGR|nr:thiamine-phosphate pyrophosphorylase [Naegleria gruberi]EFC49686.1 thiamine-phosphate pyrophosphorylase [Naegleria gruberi]|eukprot:XP_002682430.1 thiamine-phosphate pyrophosphorylase [Naegleria gruberi strain NEG-M]